MDLSVLIPARNEMFLARTIETVLTAMRGDTEIIAVLDGEWAEPQVPDHERVRLTHSRHVIGQRAAVNMAARMSAAKYVMKLDAHCAVAEGFDVALMTAAKTLGPDVTQIPRMQNLHAFTRRCTECGHDMYQGPMHAVCEACERACEFERVMVWTPRPGTKTEFWRFDQDLHFQYWPEYKTRPEAKHDIADVMSSIGACFFMARDRFWELGGLDETHGSWGQFGTEIALKSWLSGGRHVVNKGTWIAHMFRTQGGDFGFPYPIRGSDQEKARAYSRKLWLDGEWPGIVRPLSWLVEKFWPVPGWDAIPEPKLPGRTTAIGLSHQDASSRVPGNDIATTVISCDGANASRAAQVKSKGLAYYSDCRGDRLVLEAARRQLRHSCNGHQIVSVTLGRCPEFGQNFVPRRCRVCGRLDVQARRPRRCPSCDGVDVRGQPSLYTTLERGYLTMFTQQLAVLEALNSDVAFMVEHDVLYHPSHFTFDPPRDDVFYYNQHTWRVDAETGQALFYRCNQVSGLCASRALLVEHYRKRVAHVEQHGYDRNLGFEPGTNRRSRELDAHGVDTWMSDGPNVDIKTRWCVSPGRWTQDAFRNKRSCQGWTMADEVPGWGQGQTKGRFREWLTGVAAI